MAEAYGLPIEEIDVAYNQSGKQYLIYFNK